MPRRASVCLEKRFRALKGARAPSFEVRERSWALEDLAKIFFRFYSSPSNMGGVECVVVSVFSPRSRVVLVFILGL